MAPFSFFILFLAPSEILYRLGLHRSRVFTLMAVWGAYATFAYLKPAVLPLWTLVVLVYGAVILLGVTWKNRLGERAEWVLLPTLLILAYCFAISLFRWEPPGSDPTKWGTLARVFLETGKIPGDTRPITNITDLKGATMGLPILIALMMELRAAPERAIFFLECASLAIFAFGLAAALGNWFSRRAALWAALTALVLFSSPQGVLTWGGTPTLVGRVAGMSVLCLGGHWAIAILCLAFAAHAHPVGFYVSLLVCGPLAIWKEPRKFVRTVAGFAVVFSVFLFHWGFASHSEVERVWDWQRSMAPYLFRAGHSDVVNLIAQLFSYLWGTAVVISLSLFGWAVWRGTARRYALAAIGMVVISSLLVANTWYWVLPMSYLLYPERCATMMVLPLSLAFAEAWEKRGKAGFILGVCLIVFGARQFHHRLWPDFRESHLTPKDRLAIEWVGQNVPRTDSVAIRMLEGGMWIPVLAYRCTRPIHDLGLNAFDALSEAQTTQWAFYGENEPTPQPAPGTLVYDRGARIYRF
ncbi:MAG: hypothetical protein HYR96_05240 [Deltaproteobacteria bacterium]|nr:hypothetical protein [Deltaproteobacteria bacterium]